MAPESDAIHRSSTVTSRIRLSAVIAAAVLSIPLPLSAQKALSLHVGSSMSTFGGSDLGNPSMRTGVTVGASYTLPLFGVFGLQFGGSYVQKGAKDVDLGINAPTTMDVNYFELPLLLRIGVPTSGAFSAHALIGPAVGLKSNCRLKVPYYTGNVIAWDCEQANVEPKGVDLGAMGGVGVDLIATEGLQLSLDVLYDLGISLIDKRGADTKNRNLVIRFGVGFLGS